MNNQANLKIIKFGGTSVGSSSSIKKMRQIISQDQAEKKVIVVSAPSGITDMLLNLNLGVDNISAIETRILSLAADLGINNISLKKLLTQLKQSLGLSLPSDQKQDLILSFGERFSIIIISQHFNNHGLVSTPVDSRNLIATNSNFTQASCRLNFTKSRACGPIKSILDSQVLPIVTGFLGADSQGRTTTLGRGGSDLTATILGRCLSADLIEIWTDVDGVMTADPRKVKSARLIESATYSEMFKMSSQGAKVVYSLAIKPAAQANIPIRVKNTFNTESPGTLISNKEFINTSHYAQQI